MLGYKLLLAPVLLWQGKRVRNNIVKLPEPEGDRFGSAGKGAPLNILILGDSAGAGVGANHQQQALSGQLAQRLSQHYQIEWQLLAKTGENCQSILPLLDTLPSQKFDIVITSLGVNDVTSGKSLHQFENDLQVLKYKIEQSFTPKHIIFSSMPPIGKFPALPNPLRWYLGKIANSFDIAMSNFAATHQCHYFPLPNMLDIDVMAEDGFHPGPKVYQQWAEDLCGFIVKLESETQVK